MRQFRSLVFVALSALSCAAFPSVAQERQAGIRAGSNASGAVKADGQGEPRVRFDGHKVVRVQIRTADDIATMMRISDDPWTCGGIGIGQVDYRVAPDKMAELDQSGIPYKVLIANVQERIDAEQAHLAMTQKQPMGGPGLNDLSWFSDYKTYAQINAYIDTLVALRPDLASKVNLGNSLLGNAMYGIKISSPGSPSTKPSLVFNSLQHAREWISGMTTMYIADRCVNLYGTDPAITDLLNNFQVIIVPVSNPDGYLFTWSSNRLWRKNRRTNSGGTIGVDINRNWGTGWGGTANGASSSSGSSDVYHGTAAFSEPETQRLRDYMNGLTALRATIDFHSYSELILSPYGYTSSLPTNNPLYLDIDAAMEKSIEGVHGIAYTAGPTYTTIYPASGVAGDWVHAVKGAIGMGIELRDTGTYGFTLPADQIIPTAEENLAGVLTLAQAVEQPLRISFPNGVPTIVAANTATNVRVDIFNVTGTLQSGSPTLYYRTGVLGAFGSTPLTFVSGNQWRATLPASVCGATISFYVEATTTTAATVDGPAGGSASPYLVSTGTGSPLVACAHCAGDFDQSGEVNSVDLLTYLNMYFASPPSTLCDRDGNSEINPVDLLSYLMDYFGPVCP